MLDEIITKKKNHEFKQKKNLSLPPKNKSSNLEGKQYPYEGILLTPWV
jgi:hypothetical protein